MGNFVIRRPRTDRHKDIMIAAINNMILHPITGDIVLSTGTLVKVATINPAFHNSRMEWLSTGGIQSESVLNAKTNFDFLNLVERNCLRNFKGDVKEGIYVKSDFTFYGMNPSRPLLPSVDTEAKAILVANTVIDGEAARVAGGRPAYTRVARVVAALSPLNASIIIRNEDVSAHSNANIAMRELADLAGPILLTVANEVEGGYDTLTPAQKRLKGGNWGLVWILVGTPSTFNIQYVDDVTGLPLAGVFGEIDETGASDTGNGNGDATITTEAYGALIINSSRIDYTEKTTPITILEGSKNTIIIRMVKIIV
jgi:hypothetical protein